MKEAFETILGKDAVLDSAEDLEHYGKDWTKEFKPAPSLILLPRTIEDVQDILKHCNLRKIPLIPSGGRTGLAGGASATEGEVVLALDRLNKIHGVNEIGRTLTCEAGVTLEAVQKKALEHGLFFPVDLTPRGSCQIGGNLATNAGGIKVLRYGCMREHVLGLKFITAAGEVLTINGELYKNQTGYDLRNLLIGSEGTLGVIVEATLKLTAPPANQTVLICGVPDFDRMLELFIQSRKESFTLSAFECFTREGLELVLQHHPLKDPLSETFPCYALIEVEHDDEDISEALETFFEHATTAGLVGDAALSQNSKQFQEFWSLRELIGETAVTHATCHKNDLSVPIHRIPEFISGIEAMAKTQYPEFRVTIFGHVGDGNLHVNVLKPEGMENEDFFSHCKTADREIFALISKLGGSISAEHGIGLLKKDHILFSRSMQEVSFMRKIKEVFDPNGILNPGKIFDL